MNWQAVRAKARQTVHKTFAREATYTSPVVGSVPVAARIRLHTQFLRYGDLDREGYAQVIDDVNRVLVDTGEVTPERYGVIDFQGVRTYVINEVVKEPGESYWTCHVQPQ